MDIPRKACITQGGVGALGTRGCLLKVLSEYHWQGDQGKILRGRAFNWGLETSTFFTKGNTMHCRYDALG